MFSPKFITDRTSVHEKSKLGCHSDVAQNKMDPIVALVSEPATILQMPSCRQAKVTTAARPTMELDISIKEIFLNIIDRFGSAAWTLVRLPIRNETDNTL